MYIKFLKHGKGDPAKAASYLIDDVDHLNRPRPDVQVLRGDPQTFTAIAESIQNQWKYTSGVIAWSKDDAPTNDEINQVLEAFEKHAFAGLQPNQYHFTAVLHEEDDGSKHVHFLVPRIELETNKALNIAPPGHEKYFDPFRDYFNYSKGWSRPDDLTLQRDTQTPDHVHFQDKFAVRAGLKNKPVNDIREIVGSYIEQRIEHGFIRNRKDVLDAISELGTVTRTSDQFISLKIDGAEKAIRLKGAFYESEFSIESYFENRTRQENDAKASNGYRIISAEHKQLANENNARVQELSARRSKYNSERYFAYSAGANELLFDRERELELSRFNEASIRAEQAVTANHRAAEPRITAADAAIDIAYRNSADTTKRADQKWQIYVDSNNYPVSNFNFNFNGEINERITNINESTDRIIAEAITATNRSISTARELQQAIDRTKQSIEAREHPQIRVNYDTEKSNSKHRIDQAIRRFFTEIRVNNESAFTNAINQSARSIEFTASSQSTYFEQDKSVSREISTAAFNSFITGYNEKQRVGLERNRKETSTIGKLSRTVDQISRRFIELKQFIQAPTFVLKPVAGKELAEKLYSQSYGNGLVRDFVTWSERQDEALRNRDVVKFLDYLNYRYKKLNHFLNSPSNQSHEDLRIIEKIANNDKKTIKYVERSLRMRISDTAKEMAHRNISLLKERASSRLYDFDAPQSSILQKAERTNEVKRDYDNDSPSPF